MSVFNEYIVCCATIEDLKCSRWQKRQKGGRESESERLYCCFQHTRVMRTCEFLTRNFLCSLSCTPFIILFYSLYIHIPYHNTQFRQSDYPYGQSCRNMHTYHYCTLFHFDITKSFNLINTTQHNTTTICYFWSQTSRTWTLENVLCVCVFAHCKIFVTTAHRLGSIFSTVTPSQYIIEQQFYLNRRFFCL